MRGYTELWNGIGRIEGTMSKRICRLCGEDQLEEVLVIENAPRNISHLLTNDELCSDTSTTLHVYQCRACDHVQLLEELEDSFYSNYLMIVSHSPQMRAYQRQQAYDFVSQFKLARKKVIEVGCGDGNYLGYLAEADADVIGVEPSQQFRELAEQRGFKVLKGYVGRGHQLEGIPFDGFVTRQVLEHVPTPNDFLQGIRSALASDGVGLVEVPSLEQSIERWRFYDFFPDHLNYFSARTLRLILEKNGFDVIGISQRMGGEYLVALVRNRAPLALEPVQRSIGILRRNFHQLVNTSLAQGKRVAVWGAGGKGIAALASIQDKNIAYVIDSDPFKQGHFTPVSHLPVVAPKTLQTDLVDAIILTALAYRNEIINQLRQELRFNGVIAVLNRDRLDIVQEG